MGISRGGQRTILVQHPHRGNDRLDSDHSDVEAVQHIDMKQKHKMGASFNDSYQNQHNIREDNMQTRQPLSRKVFCFDRY